jgi:uncharacterized 2Fe-2S/4Fe-4S cluster protein (DUF4445 family)
MKIRLRNSPVVCKAEAGETILLACARSGFILSALCGGCHRCGKCKVRIFEGKVSGDTPDAEGFVLACLAVSLTDITIACLESGDLVDNEVIFSSVACSTFRGKRVGLAIDIGTTTVSARLIDLDNSTTLDAVSELNDQRVFGADVMSRISAAKNGETERLFALINRQTERILTFFRERWNIPKIEQLSVSGNTVMLHFFLNVDPSGMAMLPFTPAFLEARELKGEELSLSTEKVSALPSIAAFIGGDITAGLASLDVLNIPSSSLLVDIGTNSEIALVNGETIYCCSTAAGPAFEGAEISCGVGGIKGAISRVETTEDFSGISITTIGNADPVGICGSGLIDAVAVMLKNNIIDKTGCMADVHKSFYLALGISITGRGIRQFQLAKSAVLSGIRLLCKKGGLLVSKIKNVFIAGGFGFFINKQNAVATGIFPREFLDRFFVCGNLSLQGAESMLIDKNFLHRCRQITSRCSVVDLTADPAFMGEFAENMLFEKYRK